MYAVSPYVFFHNLYEICLRDTTETIADRCVTALNINFKLDFGTYF